MRHGIAVPQGAQGASSDQERPLSEKGAKRMRKIAEGLSVLKLSFDRILTSSLLRARQTAQIVAEALNIEERLEEVPELAPEGSAETLISRLASLGGEKKILLVGHQPLLGQLASFLLSRDKRLDLDLDLKKGGLCCLEVDNLRLDTPATLRCVLTPKQLRLIAR